MNILVLMIALIFISCLEALSPKAQDFVAVNFNKSMSTSYMYNKNYSMQETNWSILRSIYTQHMIKNLKISSRPRIPKIIHWIWLGSQLPEKYKKLQARWRELHPSWKFKLWTDSDVESFNLQNKKHYDRAINWGEKSDIFRYEILYKYGGLYLDIDFECLKPFDILHHTCDLYTGVGYLPNVYLYNGLIGVTPKHPIIKSCIDNIEMVGGLNEYDAIQARTGPGHFTNSFFKMLPECNKSKIVVFPVTYFYPLPNNQKDVIKSHKDIKKWIYPESFCVHYWACSWVK